MFVEALVALALATPAPEEVTIQTATVPIMKNGVLDGCELQFKAAFADNIYRQGAMSIATGSVILFGFNSSNKNLIVALKLRVTDLTGSAPNWQETTVKPAAAWVMTDQLHTRGFHRR